MSFYYINIEQKELTCTDEDKSPGYMVSSEIFLT